MRTVAFKRAERFENETQLQQCFGSDRISLEPGAMLTLQGEIELGTEIVFAGTCELGSGTSVGNGCVLTDVRLGNCNRVRPYSILSQLEAGHDNLFGPFCFVRDGCRVADDCIIGAHVEAARSGFGSGAKVSHRAFIGDAEIGANTIVGCGVVFCNWDGTVRQPTQVGSAVTLGSGTLLLPPVEIGDGAIVAAGSVITRSVDAGARVLQKRS